MILAPLLLFVTMLPQEQRIIIQPATFGEQRVEPACTLLESILQAQIISEGKYGVVPAVDVSRMLAGKRPSLENLRKVAEASWILRPTFRRHPNYGWDKPFSAQGELALTLLNPQSGKAVSTGAAKFRYSAIEPMSNTLRLAVHQAYAQLMKRQLPP